MSGARTTRRGGWALTSLGTLLFGMTVVAGCTGAGTGTGNEPDPNPPGPFDPTNPLNPIDPEDPLDLEPDPPPLHDAGFQDCNDNNTCTDDAWDPAEKTCVYTPNVGECFTSNPCIAVPYCVDGQCLGLPVDCPDQNECIVGVCDPLFGGCSVQADDSLCDDDNPCTEDFCTEGGCMNFPLEDGVSCGESDGCALVTRCMAGSCVAGPAPDGEPCDDGDPCTFDDVCSSGMCGTGVPTPAQDPGVLVEHKTFANDWAAVLPTGNPDELLVIDPLGDPNAEPGEVRARLTRLGRVDGELVVTDQKEQAGLGRPNWRNRPLPLGTSSWVVRSDRAWVGNAGPVDIWEVAPDLTVTTHLDVAGGPVRDLATSGTTLFAVVGSSSVGHRFVIIDLAQPAQPQEVFSLAVCCGVLTHDALRSRVFIPDGSGGQLIYNVSNPLNPLLVGFLPGASFVKIDPDFPGRLLVTQEDGGFEEIDAVTFEPVPDPVFESLYLAQEVTLSDAHRFATMDDGPFAEQRVDVHPRGQPEPGSLLWVVPDANYAVVADSFVGVAGQEKLTLLDLAGPSLSPMSHAELGPPGDVLTTADGTGDAVLATSAGARRVTSAGLALPTLREQRGRADVAWLSGAAMGGRSWLGPGRVVYSPDGFSQIGMFGEEGLTYLGDLLLPEYHRCVDEGEWLVCTRFIVTNDDPVSVSLYPKEYIGPDFELFSAFTIDMNEYAPDAPSPEKATFSGAVVIVLLPSSVPTSNLFVFGSTDGVQIDLLAELDEPNVLDVGAGDFTLVITQRGPGSSTAKVFDVTAEGAIERGAVEIPGANRVLDVGPLYALVASDEALVWVDLLSPVPEIAFEIPMASQVTSIDRLDSYLYAAHDDGVLQLTTACPGPSE